MNKFVEDTFHLVKQNAVQHNWAAVVEVLEDMYDAAYERGYNESWDPIAGDNIGEWEE